MEKNKVIEILKFCLNKVYTDDAYLFEVDVDERCINHRLASYLGQILETDKIKVDIEYNRDSDHLKYYDGETFGSIDILVHQRGNHENNLIAFECKKGMMSEVDMAKINALVGPEFNYQYGVTIQYNKKIAKLYQMIADKIVEEIIEI